MMTAKIPRVIAADDEKLQQSNYWEAPPLNYKSYFNDLIVMTFQRVYFYPNSRACVC